MSDSADLFDLDLANSSESAPEVAATLRPAGRESDLPASREAEVTETQSPESQVQRDSEGRFLPGSNGRAFPANPANKKKRQARKLIRSFVHEELERTPSPETLVAIACSTGIEVAELEGLSGYGVQAKVLAFKAMLGHIPSFQEAHDRLDPKRTEIEHSVSRPMAPMGDDAAENKAAEDFFEDL